MKLHVRENIRISMESIRSHLLRTILTVTIIAFGIMALVGILTAIDSIEYFLKENFTMMGANTFSIRNREMHGADGGDRTTRSDTGGSPMTRRTVQGMNLISRLLYRYLLLPRIPGR